MRQGDFNIIQAEIVRSEDYGLTAPARSAIRHGLIDKAIIAADEEVWRDVGEALIRAAEIDDLIPRLSDRFVDMCPDEVFATFAPDSAASRFMGWRCKTQRTNSLRK